MVARRSAWAAVAIAIGLGAAAGWVAAPRGVDPQQPEKELRVLFIGNSLTGSNPLPTLVAALARAGGQRRPLVARSVVIDGFSLGDHWDHGEAQRAIASGRWDFVVLQQGPSAARESRELLLRDARRFAPLIRRAGARPAFYTVWPSTSRAGDVDRVCESYRLAAAEVDGLHLPAGNAWRDLLRSDPGLALYSADGLHPTFTGSYLAALVIYGGIYDASPVGLPGVLKLPTGRPVRVDLTAERLDRLQRAAADALAARAEPAPAP